MARWVSIVAHPFVTSLVLVLGTALHFGAPGQALRTTLLVAGIGIVPIAVLMARQVRRGSWNDVDASNRSERPLLFIVGMVALAALLGAAMLLGRESFLIRGTLGVLIMLAVCAVATRWIKVSLHMAFGALAATTLILIGSPAGWFVLAALPVLAWSRLALNRHSGAEVTLGLLVGVAAGWAITS